MVARNCWMAAKLCQSVLQTYPRRETEMLGPDRPRQCMTSRYFSISISHKTKRKMFMTPGPATRSRHANYWWRILSQWRAKRSGERSERCGSSLHWHGTKSCALELMTLNAMMGNYLWARRQFFLVLTAFLLQLIGSDAYLHHTGSFIK